MFSRRMFVALAVCLVVSASSAFAGGGGGGAKKNSTIKVVNNSGVFTYAFVDVDSAKIAAATSEAELKALGGKAIQVGGNQVFSVTTGAHKVTVIDVLAPGPIFVDKPVQTLKGKTSTLNVL